MTRDEVIAYIQETEFCFLATVGTDNGPRVRPVGMKTVYGDDLYFFTFGNTRKVAEIEQNARAEGVWWKPGTMSQVRIRGTLAVEQDPAIQQRFKDDNPMVSKLLPKGAEHLFLLYKLQPEAVEMTKTLGPYTAVAW